MKLLITLLVTTLVYGMLYSQMDPDEFGFTNAIDPFYFSFSTMSTVGYGDFVPKSDRAKILVMTQQFILVGEVVTLLGIKRNNGVQ